MRFNTTLLAAAIALGLSAQSAQAIDLIAIGQLPGTLADASGQSAPLENGVRGDLLGGMGSGLAWAGGQDLRLQALWWLGALGEFAITVWVLIWLVRSVPVPPYPIN